MLYQNALVLFGFWVIYYKTICCEVNLEREKRGKSFGLKGPRKRSDRKIKEGRRGYGRVVRTRKEGHTLQRHETR